MTRIEQTSFAIVRDFKLLLEFRRRKSFIYVIKGRKNGKPSKGFFAKKKLLKGTIITNLIQR